MASALWRSENPEKAKISAAKNKANIKVKNPDANRIYAANWLLKNRDRKRATDAAWGLANRDKKKATDKAYFAANPDAMKISKQKRRARKRDAGGSLSVGLTFRLFELQRGLCPCCNKSLGTDYHLDHIMPLALGGSNTDGNVQLLRATCNHQKHAKHPVEFMQSRGFLL